MPVLLLYDVFLMIAGRPSLFYVPISHKTQMMIYNDYAPKKVDLLPYDEAKKHFPGKNTQLPPLAFEDPSAKKKKKKKKLMKGRRVSDENMVEMGLNYNQNPMDIRNNRIAPLEGSDSVQRAPDGATDHAPYGADSWDTDVYYRSHQEASQVLSDLPQQEEPKARKKSKKKKAIYRELDEPVEDVEHH